MESLVIILFLLVLLIAVFITYIVVQERFKVKMKAYALEFESQIRKDTQERMRNALKGRIGEQLAPLLPMFDYLPSDARFIGSPVDYIVFDGYSNKEPEKIVFVEVKTGKTGRLTSVERKIKQIVEEKKVEWRMLNVGDIGEELTDIFDEN